MELIISLCALACLVCLGIVLRHIQSLRKVVRGVITEVSRLGQRLEDDPDFMTKMLDDFCKMRNEYEEVKGKHERATAKCAKLAARLARAEAKIERMKPLMPVDSYEICDGKRVPNPFAQTSGGIVHIKGSLEDHLTTENLRKAMAQVEEQAVPQAASIVSDVEKAILHGVDDLLDHVLVQPNDSCGDCLFNGDFSRFPCPSCGAEGSYFRRNFNE